MTADPTIPTTPHSFPRLEEECLPETALRLLVTTTQSDAATLREVASTLSHELRTPLTTIYTGSKLLSRTASSSPNPVVREVSAAIEAAAERLMRIVEDLVVAAALPDEPAVAGEPLLLQHLLPGASHEEIGDGGATLVLRVPAGLAPVRGEAAFVSQIIRNLLANAVAYGPATGTIVVQAAATVDGHVEVHVLDEGPGVASEDVTRLFRLFSQAATRRRQGGLGLGLFVARRLVELMNGRVWYRRRDHCGSDFGFALPIYPADE